LMCAVFNLVEGIDVEQTEQRLKAYKSANIASIEANRIRKVRLSVLGHTTPTRQLIHPIFADPKRAGGGCCCCTRRRGADSRLR
jgi:hypothetical protein